MQDVDGNKVHSGGDAFAVTVAGPHGHVDAKVHDNNNGTYSVEYTPQSPGDYEVNTTLHNVPLHKFPKKVHFKPSMSLATAIHRSNTLL